MSEHAKTPQREVAADGMSGQFIAELLSAFLAHEQCGAELYQQAASRTKNPVLQAKYEEFGKQTQRHIEILTSVIAQGGGDPQYRSPMALATETQDRALVKATIDAPIDDLMTEEMAMLDAVFVAESVDHANWQTLAKLAEQLGRQGIGVPLARAVAEVEPQEDEHLSWATETRAKLTMLQSRSSAARALGEKAEEAVAMVRNWLKS